MFSLLGWIVYGLICGIISKALYPGKDDPTGFLPTVLIGVVGSYIGGSINWLLGNGASPFQSSGILMGIVGGVICCWAWRFYRTKFASDEGPRSFWTGKKL